ncbi:ParA family protein [Marinobacterium stanieri]|uniref:Chromosome partitioning protein n=1 Tax=Marinobacterium stanieri TaxID=49186 RepID=A0A1N6XJU9_9GAMM|nr:ParA family protein [Marinobacterium stanieri]SIR02612.1 chromosome partitioning protein [Marinobacterium stanieri]
MSKVLVVANNKGGVAKTTTSVGLAAYFGQVQSKRVLIVDCDPQCNLTAALIDVNYRDLETIDYLPEHPETGDRYSISHIYDSEPLAPYPTRLPNCELIPNLPSNLVLDRGTEDDINTFVEFFHQDAIAEQYDVVIMDTPPAKGTLTTSAIRASTHILIPCVMEERGVEGLLGMVAKVMEEKDFQAYDRETEVLGVLPTKFDSRMRIHKAYLSALNDPERMGDLSNLMIPSQLDQGKSIDSFVIKERALLKEMELKGANPITPFGMARSTDVYKEWLALGRYVEGRMF